ncbi:sensor domain-containing protein [Mycolicibacillus trivialis]|nr:sensor domain-containing protein [Mycolicibacillus trivialis]
MSVPPHLPPQHGFPPGGDPRRRPGVPPGPYRQPPPYGPPPQQYGYPPHPGYQPPGQPWPSGPPPLGGPGGAPPSNSRQLLMVGAGLLVALLVLMFVVVGVTRDDSGSDDTATTASPSSAEAAPPSSDAASPTSSTTSASSPSAGDLAGLLESPAQINDRMKTTMTPAPGESGSEPLTKVTVTPSECTGNFIPATAAVYAGSGFTAMAVQGFRGPGDKVSTSVIEAAVRFPDAAAAKRFFNDRYADMSDCTYKPVTAAYGDGASYDGKTTAVGKSSGSEGDLINTIIFRNPMEGTIGCDRALGVNADVIVDVLVCSDGNSGGYGTGLARAIMRKVS